ncbi:MAG: PucR family transcriptional regulator [Corynebacterium sp.]|uniref:PucR family transcriptional regulator n=1 Tax=Corynebacterium sp. TaxID=1720 RepID=UPI0026DC4E58|nr:PucR family transcriptional regulator [Corynebacterium sp.]MDO5029864.1 PucR family transcriptional regulator [Corynebacterium sp.]
MRLTVASLARRPELGLTLLTGQETAQATPVEWAHAIDREDSDKWIAPGTLVLTSGYQFPSDKEGQIAHVEALHRAGACALAIDTGGRWTSVPQAIVDYGLTTGFPVMSVAATTAFSTVVRAVAEDIAEARVQQLAELNRAQTELVTLLLRGGLDAVVQHLAQDLNATVVVTDSHGDKVSMSVSDDARQGRPGPGRDDDALFRRVAPEVLYTPQVGRSVIHPRGSRVIAPLHGQLGGHFSASADSISSRQGALIVDSARNFDEPDRFIVSFAASIISLSTSRSATVHAAEERLRQQCLIQILNGQQPLPEQLSLFGIREDAQVTALFITGLAAESHDMLRFSESLRGLGWNYLYALRPAEAGYAVLAQGSQRHKVVRTAVNTLYQRLRVENPQVRIGIGSAGALSHAALSMRQAHMAVPKNQLAVPVRSVEELPAPDLILSTLAGTEAVNLLTDGAHRALADHDDAHGTELLAATRAFIDTNGRFEAMAKSLGIHRQTAKSRVNMVEDVLGRSMDDPDLRAELWLAFKAARFQS